MKHTFFNSIRKTALLLGLMCIGASSAYAVPAYPGLIDYKLPDGTSVKITLKGDEAVHWAETPDGYTLLKDSDDYWVFAQEAKVGGMEVSDIRYRGNSQAAVENGIEKGLRFSHEQVNRIKSMRVAANNSLLIDGSFPSSGKCKLLLLLINYADTKVTYSQEEFNNFMNQHNYAGVGSFRDFYLEQSGGKLDIETTVTPWVNLKFDKQIYGADGAINMIVDAIGYLGDEIDLRDFDNDGDGVLDGLAVIHQGKGQEMTGSGYDIWSHSSMIYGYSFNGVTLRRYTIQPETLSSGKMSNIGVICHEFGHNLGAPDFYDTDYESSGGYYPGTGVWDVMGSGMWNGTYGDHPAGMNVWMRSLLGWVDVKELTETQEVSNIQSSEIDPVAYKMSTTTPGEYYIMENRQRTSSFNSVLPGSGLLVYHINEQKVSDRLAENTLNASFPQTAFTVCANADNDPTEYVSSYGYVDKAGCPFPGSDNITSFNDRTYPSTKSMSGRQSYIALENIKNEDGLVSFRFVKEEAPASPINLHAEVNKGEVTLAWDLEDKNGDTPDHYTVYCDDIQIGTTKQRTFKNVPKKEGLLMDYTVDAVYADGRVSLLASTQICVPANKVTEIELTPNNGNMQVRWTVNPTISRNQTLTESNVTGFDFGELDYAQRFTSEDLLTYKLSKISKVAVLPYMPPTELALTVRVWEADNTGANPTVVSEQEVKEFGTASWREVLLTKPVTIKSNKEYWIGAHCKSTSGSLRMLTDKGPILEGRGNMICVDGEWKEAADVAGNFFAYAVTTPNTPLVSTSVPSSPTLESAKFDLLYPIGFMVYRDGNFIGKSGNCYYVDKNVPEGDHTYMVSCIYKGNNESVGLEATTSMTGIDGVDNDSFVALGADGGIYVRGAVEPVSVYDLSGRKVAYTDGAEFISLNKGMYMVKSGKNVRKVMVR